MLISVDTATFYELRHTYISLDNKNVTNDCFAADNDEGWVDIYKRDENGNRYIVHGGTPESREPAWERLHGEVQILVMPKERLEPCAKFVTTKTVAPFPTIQQKKMACYCCGFWVAETKLFDNDEQTFIHIEPVVED